MTAEESKTTVTPELKTQVLELVNRYQLVTREQILAWIPFPPEVTGRAIAHLVDKRKIFPTSEGYVSHPSLALLTSKLQIYKKILWLLIVLNEKFEIDENIFQNDKFIVCTFIAKNELFDIVYVSLGSEYLTNNYVKAKERYLSEEERNSLHRIVVMDSADQKDMIDITSTDAYVTISDSGEVQFV